MKRVLVADFFDIERWFSVPLVWNVSHASMRPKAYLDLFRECDRRQLFDETHVSFGLVSMARAGNSEAAEAAVVIIANCSTRAPALRYSETNVENSTAVPDERPVRVVPVPEVMVVPPEPH